MTARKKWRLVLWPGAHSMPQTSMKRAYERVVEIREDHKLGLTRTELVVVQVDAGDGWGWRTHERIHLALDK